MPSLKLEEELAFEFGCLNFEKSRLGGLSICLAMKDATSWSDRARRD